MKKLALINQRFIKAVQNNRLDELKNLLSQGADIHADDDGALRWSAEKGHLEVVKFLLSNGANIHADDDYALRFSAAKSHIEIVKFLIAQGANIHANDDEALMLAACYGQLEIVKFLIAHGADIHANNDQALKDSALRGHNDVWQVLSAFIQEEKLLVTASGVMPLVAASESTSASSCLRATEATAGSTGMPHIQPLAKTKNKRSKV